MRATIELSTPNLNIENSTKKYLLFDKIKKKLFDNILLNLSRIRVEEWNKYFKNNDYNFTFYQLLNKAYNNIDIVPIEQGIYQVKILDVMFMGKSLSELINLLSYGNNEIKGYNIISKAFDDLVGTKFKI